MADFAPNSTPRFKVQYRHANAEHVVQVRVARDTNPLEGAVLSKLNSIFHAVSSSRFSDFAFLSASYIGQDSSIETPLGMGELTSAGGSQPIASARPVHKGLQTRFVGRGNTGSPVSLTIFGLNFDGFATLDYLADFRITRNEVPTVATALDFLTEVAPAFTSVNGPGVIWKQYVNVKVNDAWLRAIRA